MYYPLDIKQTYNFTLKATGILGLGYKNATVMAIMDFESAKLIQDIVSIHAQVYPDLTVGTPRNAADLTYVKIRTVSGEIRVIAFDWLAAAPELVTSKTIRVTISDVSINDISLVTDVLVQNGFPNVVVEVV